MPIPTLLAKLDGDLAYRDRAGIGTLTASGPVRYVPGKPAGSSAYVAEEGTANLVGNPSFEVDTSGWQGVGSTISRAASGGYAGDAAVQVVTLGGYPGEGLMFSSTTAIAATVGQTWALSMCVKGSGTVRLRLSERSNVGGDLSTFSSDLVTTLTGNWQRVVYVRTTTQAGCAYLRPSVATDPLAPAQAVTFLADAIQLEQKPYATSYADGSLGPAYTWAGTANASASTRAASSLSIPAASFPASLAVRYSEDAGATWQVATLSAPGPLGTRGTVAHAGGIITITAVRMLLIDGVIGFDRALTDAEKARLEATPTWAWDTLIPRVAGILRIGQNDGIGGLLRIGGQ